MLKKIIMCLFLFFNVVCFGNIYTVTQFIDYRHIDQSGYVPVSKACYELLISAHKTKQGIIELELLSMKASNELDATHPSHQSAQEIFDISGGGQEIKLEAAMTLNPENKKGVLIIPGQDLEISFNNWDDLEKNLMEIKKIESQDELLGSFSAEVIAAYIIIYEVPLILKRPDNYSDRTMMSLIKQEYPFARSDLLRGEKTLDVERIGDRTVLKHEKTICREERFSLPREMKEALDIDLSGFTNHDIVFSFDERHELESARIFELRSTSSYRIKRGIEITRVDLDLRYE